MMKQNYLVITFRKLQLSESCNKLEINILSKNRPLSILLIYSVQTLNKTQSSII